MSGTGLYDSGTSAPSTTGHLGPSEPQAAPSPASQVGKPLTYSLRDSKPSEAACVPGTVQLVPSLGVVGCGPGTWFGPKPHRAICDTCELQLEQLREAGEGHEHGPCQVTPGGLGRPHYSLPLPARPHSAHAVDCPAPNQGTEPGTASLANPAHSPLPFSKPTPCLLPQPLPLLSLSNSVQGSLCTALPPRAEAQPA